MEGESSRAVGLGRTARAKGGRSPPEEGGRSPPAAMCVSSDEEGEATRLKRESRPKQRPAHVASALAALKPTGHPPLPAELLACLDWAMHKSFSDETVLAAVLADGVRDSELE